MTQWGGLIERSHPEGMCAGCGGPNVAWHAPSDLWNAVMGRDRHLILCPVCFVVRADRLAMETTGSLPVGWLLSIEDPRNPNGFLTERDDNRPITTTETGSR